MNDAVDEEIRPPAPAAPEAAAAVLAGRYRRVARLGNGQSSVVYLAEDLHVGGRQVALKMAVQSQDPSRTAAARDHLLQEAQALALLRHPGVPHLGDVLVQGDRCALVLEYLPGRTIWDIAGGAPVAERQVLDWGLRLCDIVVRLHSQRPPLAHGALHAGHCMILPGGRLVLFDFGTATLRPTAEREHDVHALVLLLYQLLTGSGQRTGPFPPVRSLANTVSVATDRVLSTALQPAPDSPPLTAAVLRQQLLKCCAALGLAWGLCPYCQATAHGSSRYCDLCGGTLDTRGGAPVAPVTTATNGVPTAPLVAAAPSSSATPAVLPGTEGGHPGGTPLVSDRAGAPRRPVSYAARLRAVGRYIDEQGLRQITIVDDGEGFLLRGQRNGMGRHVAGVPRGSVSILVGAEELERLNEQAHRRNASGEGREQGRPIRNTLGSGPLALGYEDRLRALGRELDVLQSVSHVTIIETATALYLHYDRTGVDIPGGMGHQHLTLFAPDLDRMSAVSKARRGTGRGPLSLRDLIQ